MNWAAKKPKQLELTDALGRPKTVTVGGKKFFEMCKQARAGEFRIWAMDSLSTAAGKNNGLWRLHLTWPQPGRSP